MAERRRTRISLATRSRLLFGVAVVVGVRRVFAHDDGMVVLDRMRHVREIRLRRSLWGELVA